ncbi:MAG: hypothetical protein LBB40_05345 [Holophagales bacterium]|nr:hypothetical protein [Holophagales bacterium]
MAISLYRLSAFIIFALAAVLGFTGCSISKPGVRGDAYVVTLGDNNTWKYWKNGVETKQFNADGFVYGTNFSINSDSYLAEYDTDSDDKGMVIIKKNGSVLYYLADEKFDVYANRVFVSGDDVYAAGHESNQQGKSVAAVWKNSKVLYRLTNGSFHASAWSLLVSGDDVYAAGYEYNPRDNIVATVWKNGRELYRLTNGNFSADVRSLFVSSGDVYAAGYENNRQGNQVAAVWKNGRVLYRLKAEVAELVFVK